MLLEFLSVPPLIQFFTQIIFAFGIVTTIIIIDDDTTSDDDWISILFSIAGAIVSFLIWGFLLTFCFMNIGLIYLICRK